MSDGQKMGYQGLFFAVGPYKKNPKETVVGIGVDLIGMV